MSFVYATSFADYNAMDATTAASGFPATNAGNRKLPFWPWRSTTTGSDQKLHFDCGTSKAIAGICLYDVNVASVKMALSSDAVTYGTGLPGYTTSTVFTPALDEEDGRYKLYITFSPTTSRAFELLFPSGTSTTDSASYFRCGTIFWIQATTTLTRAPALGMGATWSGNETQAQLANGRLETMSNGDPYLRFSTRQIVDGTSKTEWNLVKNTSQGGTPYLWMFNLTGSSQDAYFCVRDGDVSVSKTSRYDEHQINWRQLV